MTPAEHGNITHVMQSYFDGLYHADSTLLRKVFHPKLAYVCATEGDALYLDLDTYMSRIDQREAPAKRNEHRRDRILEVSIKSPRLAHVSARMTMMDRDYLDVLTLVPYGGEWRVISKVFSYVEKDA
ncbi:nuclear transport factor 2 family protein [Shimia sp. NS0008-38b]|uniref:nuclear transport factor 2 family protein n=1 Tax=Shimia sp. NS0008-38b TaxID=3127653 RepID=UPI00310825C3